ncbi:MAG: YmdB family metallophosphoesterase, partial [Anaerolineae bacterium]|nr:YmdB family metallophosphoesterase [Anaerolineae bacterium]
MANLLFVGDMVGEVALAHLEARLPDLRAAYQPDFIVVNGENLAINIGLGGHGWCGMTPDLLVRLFSLGADVITGGNHSWDGPYGRSIHDEARLIRPLNYGRSVPGRGAIIVSKNGLRLGVVNVTSRSAMEQADNPFEATERQLEDWAGQTDAVLVDFHGEFVTEKQTYGFAFDGRVTAVLGTHT